MSIGSTAPRRRLRFLSLDQVIPDVERLLAAHTTVGRWSLAEICNHLELAIRLPMEGVPKKAPWLVRRAFGPAVRSLSFALNWMPRRVPVYAIYLPRPGQDANRAVDSWRATIERFRSFAGPLDEHPLLGRMSSPQWERFHCLHCAHHLSFAIPR